MVQSGWLEIELQLQPVAVVVAPDQSQKTRLNQTLKH